MEQDQRGLPNKETPRQKPRRRRSGRKQRTLAAAKSLELSSSCLTEDKVGYVD